MFMMSLKGIVLSFLIFTGDDFVILYEDGIMLFYEIQRGKNEQNKTKPEYDESHGNEK